MVNDLRRTNLFVAVAQWTVLLWLTDKNLSNLNAAVGEFSSKKRKMSTEETDKYVDWLEESITNKYIKFYEYSEFKNIQPIGYGAFGCIFRADWKSTDTTFALKSFNNQRSTLKEVVSEV